MASTIVYKGVRRGTPGVYPTVNAGALTPVPGAASAGVAIIGSALSGTPVTDAMTVDEFYDAFYCSSPSAEVGPNRKYVSGELFEAANALKRAGKAPSPLFLVKVGDDTTASTTVSGAYGTAFTLTADTAGSRGNLVSFELENGSAQGWHTTLTTPSQTFEKDDLGGDTILSLLYTPGSYGWTGISGYFSGAGFKTHAYKTVTAELADDVVSPDGYVTITYTGGSDGGKTLTIFGTSTAGAAQVEHVLLTSGGSPMTSSKTWGDIYGAQTSEPLVAGLTIADSTPTTIVTFIAADRYRHVAHCERMDVADLSTLTVSASTSSAAKIFVYGTSSTGAEKFETITLSGTANVPAVGADTDWASISAIVHGGVADSVSIVLSALSHSIPAATTLEDLESILARNPGMTVAIDGAWNAETLDVMDYTGSISLLTTAKLFTADLETMLDYMTAVYAGSVTPAEIAWTPMVKTLTFSGSATGDLVLNGLTFAIGATAAATKAIIDKHAHATSAVRYQVSTAVSGSDLVITALQVNGFTLSLSGTANVTMANTTATAGQSSFSRGLSMGTTISPARYFTGGTDAAATVANYTTALEKLRDFELNSIVVLSGDDAVHAALAEHLDYMEGLGGSERQGFVGLLNAALDDVPTKTEIRTQIRALNNRNITASVQAASWLDAAGTLTEYLPTMVAVLKAGAEIGQPLGVPTTHKTLGSGGTVNLVSYVRQDSSWNPRADSDELIDLGATILETTPQGKVRVVRHITTWLEDDNLAYANASVNRVVNFLVRDIRGTADAFVGTAGVRRTVQAVCDKIDDRLKMRLREELITSFSPTTGTLSGDVLTLRIEFAPTVDINFIVPNITLSASNIT